MSLETQILTGAHAAWSAAATLRQRRDRFKRYTYGDQWGDMVDDGRGHVMREGDLVSATGRRPLTNNLIRRLVKTIVGRWRNVAAQTRRYDGSPLATTNALVELDSRLLEEFLISGCAIQRVSRGMRPGQGADGVWVDNVNPCRFFTNRFTDPRGLDVEMAGMLHDMSLAEVLARFAHGDRRRADWLRGVFAAVDAAALCAVTGEAADFFTAPDGRCRVIEVWTLEAVEHQRRVNDLDISFEWRCRWLSPAGDLLDEGKSPFVSGCHPFVIKYYPLTDGEVHPFVEDVIDQQRYINRLIVLIDKMMGAAAKGVLLFPVDQKVQGVSWDDVRDRWSAADGVIPIMGRSDVLPHQVTTGNADAGAHKLLEIELKLFEDVSGVSDALMGRAAAGNGGSALYESQIANSTIALADTLDTFAAFTERRDALASQFIASSNPKRTNTNEKHQKN